VGEAASDADDLALGEADGLGDVPVGPPAVGVVLVGQQEDAGAAGLGGRDVLQPAEALQFGALRGGEVDLVLAVGRGHPYHSGMGLDNESHPDYHHLTLPARRPSRAGPAGRLC
jgi:hypothetical protein